MSEEQSVELYKLAHSVCKNNNVKYDEDLIQELVFHAFQQERYFDSTRSKWSTFMYVCMKQKLTDTFKFNKRLKRDNGKMTYSLDYQSDEDAPTLLDKISNEDEFVEDNTYEDFLSVIDHLIEEPLRLYLNGYSQVEIGKMKGCTGSYISYLIKKNIEKIKEYCEENKLYL